MNNKISSMYLDGVSMHNISKELNINYYNIKNFIKTNNLKLIKEKYLISKIIELRNQNKTFLEISKTLNISLHTVYNIRKKNKLNFERKKIKKKLTDNSENEIIYLLKNTTLSLRKIGNKYNVSRQWVYAIQKKFNIKRI